MAEDHQMTIRVVRPRADLLDPACERPARRTSFKKHVVSKRWAATPANYSLIIEREQENTEIKRLGGCFKGLDHSGAMLALKAGPHA
jgi:hypothetical protein